MCGGYGNSNVESSLATIKAQAGLWDAILKNIGAGSGDNVVVDSVEQQVVAGMNYKFALTNQTSSKKHRVVIYKPLPHTGAPMTITSIEAI
jgi:hypothetical protein